jgi:hypothetical protein
MRFSPQQDRALCAAARWLHAGGAPVFRLFGYAGTGKTTLAKHLAEHIDGRVRFAAYTGKAAHVMRAKGCKDAGTLHSLIYTCTETEDGPLFELSGQSPLAEAALLIVDECSMVDAKLGKDLLSFGKPILVLGDPEQLPPVHGAGFFTAAAPDVLLTDIQRQARDNPIIHMATTVREGGRLAVGNYGCSRIVNAVTLTELAMPIKFSSAATARAAASMHDCAITLGCTAPFRSRMTVWYVCATTIGAACSMVRPGARALRSPMATILSCSALSRTTIARCRHLCHDASGVLSRDRRAEAIALSTAQIRSVQFCLRPHGAQGAGLAMVERHDFQRGRRIRRACKKVAVHGNNPCR